MNNMYKLDERQMELLDLYAIDAIDGEEKEQAEELMRANDEAQRYVDEARTKLSLFELNEPASSDLLDKIKSQIKDSSDDKNVIPLNERRGFFLPFLCGAAAASVAMFIGCVALWPSEKQNTSTAFSLERQVNTFAEQEGVENISFENTSGDPSVAAMVHDGDIMIDARDIEELGDDYTYQLWAIIENETGQQVISAGVLGNGPGVYMTHVDGKVKSFVITKEVYGGVEKSSQKPAYTSNAI